MSKAMLIGAGDVPAWLDAIIKKYSVVAPQKVSGSEIAFLRLASGADAVMDFINPAFSPLKEALFPQQEDLIRYKRNGTSWEAETIGAGGKTVLFGVRSCDVAAMLFTDRFFLEGFKDNYYAARRDNVITVSLSCTDPAEHCFCVCADAGPSRESGFDVQLTRLDGKYLVETGSAAGEELVGIAGHLFADAGESDIKKKNAAVEEVIENRFRLPTTYFSKAVRHMTAADIDEKNWDRLGARCVACGSCSYVCPTCTCFNVLDEGSGAASGVRGRTWDSCMYGGFTREVSGHNPRASQKERVKRRFYHKLSYHYVRKMGAHGCVGCGRCVASCPGSVDIWSVSRMLRRNG